MREPSSLKSRFILRTVCDTLLLGSLFYLPWWATALFALLLLFYFRNFYEIIIIGALVDMVYGIPRTAFGGIEYINTLFAALAYLSASWLKRFLRRESVIFAK